MDTEIRQLLDGAVSQQGRRVDIADVQRRVRRRRRTRAAGAVLALAIAVPVSINALQWLPRPDVAFSDAPGSEPVEHATQEESTSDGKFVVVHRFTMGGKDRELVAYRSRHGLCLGIRDVEHPANMSSGCGYGVPQKRLVGVGSGWDAAGLTVEGPVAKQVADVAVELHDGTLVDAGPYSAGDRFPVNFYLAAFPVGTKATAVIGFDADGKQLERHRLRQMPPPLGSGEIGRSAKAQLADETVTGATPRAAAMALARELGRDKLRVRTVVRVAATDTRVLIRDSTGCWVYAASDPDEDGTWTASGGEMPCNP